VTSHGLACETYQAFVYAYDRVDGGPWQPFDYRLYTATGNSSGSSCDPVLSDHGVDDPDFSFPATPAQLWFTPSRHQGGVLVVSGMYRGCEPLPLDVRLAEYF
jgi:hypothetical protein